MATCTKPMRGKTDVKLPPKGQHDPCALLALTSVGGVNVAVEGLCLMHWMLKNGQQALIQPVV
jgi:hypothetical protein